MKEHPILFSAPMVRAIIAGTKTQTRRVMRYQPHEAAAVTVEHFNQTVIDRHGDEQPGPEIFGAWWADGECGIRFPYGQPGDRLWVREAHSIRVLPSAQAPDGIVWYRESDIGRQWDGEVRWKPSIHMPRWASRILLEITSVRVERLHDISRGDAMAEGCPFQNMADGPDPTQWYADLWQQINGPGSWSINPWVWVIEFKRVYT